VGDDPTLLTVKGSTIPLVVCSMTGYAGGSSAINTYYVDGVSVTYGYPRQHIWSFACGVDETNRYSVNCPCVTGSTVTVPSFVGQNYFCESGLTRWNGNFIFHSNGDPLWDGQGCGPTSSCCTLNSPPWFSVTWITCTDYPTRSMCRKEHDGILGTIGSNQ